MSTTQPIRNPEKLQEFKEYYLLKKHNDRNYTLCVLGLNTALRISDILHLKWGDVYDFSRNEYLTHITITEQKTGKTNQNALNQTILETLKQYYTVQKKSPAAENYLFPSRKGVNRPLGRSQAFRIIKEAADSLGMNQEHISCHSLRKTFGYYAWQQGIPPVLLMNIFNHSSFQITKRYLGIEQDEKDNVFLNIAL